MECDQRLESEVRSVKDKMDAMGKNLTLVSAQRILHVHATTQLQC